MVPNPGSQALDRIAQNVARRDEPVNRAASLRARRFTSLELETAVRRAAWSCVVEPIVRCANALAAERTAQRAIRDLQEMDDRELRDFGISRSDIPRVVRQTGR